MAERFTKSGHLTGFSLRELMEGRMDELGRLEASEHLAFCDACLERYTRLLTDDVLLEAPDLLEERVMARVRRKARELWMNKYFSAGLAACIAMVMWVTGVFSSIAFRPDGGRLENLSGATQSFSQMAREFSGDITQGLSDFLDSIDLRGVFTNEKK